MSYYLCWPLLELWLNERKNGSSSYNEATDSAVVETNKKFSCICHFNGRCNNNFSAGITG